MIVFQIQLRRERTEERRRMFQLVERRRRGVTSSNDLGEKWKKLLPALPSTRDEESTGDQPTGGAKPDNASRRKGNTSRNVINGFKVEIWKITEWSGYGKRKGLR